MDLLKKIYKKEIVADVDYFFLVGSIFLFTLLRIPSLVEPDWYGDEGIYQVIGRALNVGRLLYRDIWDNKPPVLYLYYAVVDGDLFAIRLLSLIFGVFTIVALFFLARKLFQKKRLPVFVTTGVFAFLFGIPLLEGNIANAENFMLLPIILAIYLVTRLKNNTSFFLPIISGLLLSLAFLTKIVALFDLGAVLVMLLCLRFASKPLSDLADIRKNLKLLFSVYRQELILVVSFLTPIIFTVLLFLFFGALPDYYRAAFSQNIGYVGYGNALSFSLGPLSLHLNQGLLFLKILALFAGVYIIFRLRNKLKPEGIIIYSWLIFSLFNTFFSGRPYTHYILVALPVLCLFFGMLFTKMRLQEKLFHVALFVIVLLFIKNNFGLYTKITPYYINYLDFIQGNKSVDNYQKFFDRVTPRDYAIARFIEGNASDSDNVFLVSDSGQIYFLSDKLPPGRYIVSYHVTFYPDGISETQKAVLEKNPKYIIVTKPGDLYTYFTSEYELKYILEGAKIYERSF